MLIANFVGIVGVILFESLRILGLGGLQHIQEKYKLCQDLFLMFGLKSNA